MSTISKLTESISKNEQKTKELNQQIEARSKSHKILKVSWGHAKCVGDILCRFCHQNDEFMFFDVKATKLSPTSFLSSNIWHDIA